MVIADCFSLGQKIESAQVLDLTHGPFLCKSVIWHCAGKRKGVPTSAPLFHVPPVVLGSGALFLCALHCMSLCLGKRGRNYTFFGALKVSS